MVFLPGDRVLDMNIKFANVSRLIMCNLASACSLYTLMKQTTLSATQQRVPLVLVAQFCENNSSLSFCGTSNFSHNSPDVGGAVGTVDNVAVTFNRTSNFVNNLANKPTNDIIKIVCLDYHREPWVDEYAPVTKPHS